MQGPSLTCSAHTVCDHFLNRYFLGTVTISIDHPHTPAKLTIYIICRSKKNGCRITRMWHTTFVRFRFFYIENLTDTHTSVLIARYSMRSPHSSVNLQSPRKTSYKTKKLFQVSLTHYYKLTSNAYYRQPHVSLCVYTSHTGTALLNENIAIFMKYPLFKQIISSTTLELGFR